MEKLIRICGIRSSGISTQGTAMNGTTAIALDAMGGDHGPQVVVPAALKYLEKDTRSELILVGQEDALSSGTRPTFKSDHRQPQPLVDQGSIDFQP